MSNFGIGWYKSRSFWSEGKKSTINFKLSENDINNTDTIILSGNIFNYERNNNNKLEFELNGHVIKEKISTINNMQNITLSFPNQKILKNLNKLEIINYNTETRQSMRIAPDPRLLGIKLNYIEIK